MMTALRRDQPSRIGSFGVERIDDFVGGFDAFPPGDILRIWLENGARVVVRPSGTEPKLKIYIDASSTAGDAGERIATAQAIVDELDTAMRALVR